jgi:predicted peptidase
VLIDHITHTYNVDVSRIHITGFSMGGYSAWALAMRNPQCFASVVPISSPGDHHRAASITDIPQWIFHGECDDVFPIDLPTQMVDALKQLGAREVRFSTYPSIGHDCWTAAYGELELWKWMLQQRRVNIASQEKENI